MTSTDADTARHRAWIDEGTALFSAAVNALSPEQLREPSLLPGWSRAHVAAHVARNAQGIQRLATWARTGVETPMYPSREFRDMQIEETAEFTDGQLRDLVTSTAHDLEHAFSDLDAAAAWDSVVKTFQGRDIPARFIAWLRVREVWIHAVDLGSGITFDALPGSLQAELLGDVATGMADRRNMPSAVVTDGVDSWIFGQQGGEAPIITGNRPALLAWLLGRPGGAVDPLENPPELPAWI